MNMHCGTKKVKSGVGAETEYLSGQTDIEEAIEAADRQETEQSTPSTERSRPDVTKLACQYEKDGWAPIPIANKPLSLPAKGATKQYDTRAPLCPWKKSPGDAGKTFNSQKTRLAKAGYPHTDIGIGVSMAHSGAALIDLDSKHYVTATDPSEREAEHDTAARQLLTNLARECGVPEGKIAGEVDKLMKLPHARSQSGSLHIILRTPKGAKLHSKDGVVKHVDVKAGYVDEDGVAQHGGIAFAPGTVTEKGAYRAYGVDENGEFYKRDTYVPVDELPEAPDWFVAHMSQKPKKERKVDRPASCTWPFVPNTLGGNKQFDEQAAALVKPSSPYHAYVKGAVNNILSDLYAAEEGTGNEALNTAAYALGQLEEHIDIEGAEAVLVHVDMLRSQRLGQDERPVDEANATIASGLEAGRAQPRDLSSVKAQQARLKTKAIVVKLDVTKEVDDDPSHDPLSEKRARAVEQKCKDLARRGGVTPGPRNKTLNDWGARLGHSVQFDGDSTVGTITFKLPNDAEVYEHPAIIKGASITPASDDTTATEDCPKWLLGLTQSKPQTAKIIQMPGVGGSGGSTPPPAGGGSPSPGSSHVPQTFKELCEAHDYRIPKSLLPVAVRLFNKEHAVVDIGGKVAVMRSVQTDYTHRISKSEFKFKSAEHRFMFVGDFRTLYCNVKVVAQILGAEGEPKTKITEFADEWLAHRERLQYDGVGFYPSGFVPSGRFNTWAGFRMPPKAGNWSRLKNHILDNICSGNVDHYELLLDWMAQTLQKPEEKIGTAVALRGEQGVGKSKLSEWLGFLLGVNYMTISNGEQLTGRFNQHLLSIILVGVEEGFWAGDKKAEGVLKDLITNNNVTIEGKFQNAVRSQSCARLLVTSNSDWIVPAGLDDRRWIVLDVASTCKQNTKYFAAIDRQMMNGGAEAMLHELLNRRYNEDRLRKPPRTDAKAHQAAQSLKPTERWLLDVVSTGEIRVPSVDMHGEGHTHTWDAVAGDWGKSTPNGTKFDVYELSETTNTRISRDVVFAAYELTDRARYANDRASRTALGMYLAGVFPHATISTMKAGRYYVLPPLSEMRKLFEKHMGYSIDALNGGCTSLPLTDKMRIYNTYEAAVDTAGADPEQTMARLYRQAVRLGLTDVADWARDALEDLLRQDAMHSAEIDRKLYGTDPDDPDYNDPWLGWRNFARKIQDVL